MEVCLDEVLFLFPEIKSLGGWVVKWFVCLLVLDVKVGSSLRDFVSFLIFLIFIYLFIFLFFVGLVPCSL